MKNKIIAILLAALAFSGLFYDQQPGINFFLFTLMTSALILLYQPQKRKEKTWWLYLACANLCGLAVFTTGSALSVFGTIVSLVALSSKSVAPHNSILLNGFFGLYSLARAPFDLMLNAWRSFNADGGSKNRRRNLLAGILIALVPALLFLLLYRASNPLFSAFTERLDLSWIDLPRILFTLFGLFVIYGLVKSRTIATVAEADLQQLRDLHPRAATASDTGSTSTVIYVSLFVMINLMLLVINALDIDNLYISRQLPEGIKLSAFVHEAVTGLVASIIIAAALIAGFFQRELNFTGSGKWLRGLTYAWMIQSVIQVVNALTRNYQYVSEYQLTHLRIAVFVFLLLSLCGLALTYRKVRLYKSAWWLAAINARLWFFVLVAASLVNWDRQIAVYNSRHADEARKLDTAYLLELSDAVLPQLTQLHNAGELKGEEKHRFYRKMLREYNDNLDLEWPGYSLRRKQNNEALLQLEMNTDAR